MARSQLLSRRALLGTGAGAFWGCAVRSQNVPEPEVQKPHRIAIVGGGLAGLSCAYFLRQAELPITVFEAGNQLGGRIHTLRNDLPENLFCELGGEFIDPRHATLRTLAATLGIRLDSQEFAADRRFYWVGDRRVNEADVVRTLSAATPGVLAAFEAAERTEQGIVDLDRTPLSQWLEQQIPRDENLDLSILLESAFRAQFGREVAEQSSINAILMLSDGADAVFGPRSALRAREGNDQFTIGLRDQSGAQLRLNSRLRTLDRKNDGTYRLEFETPMGVGFVEEAERVVLALPFATLRKVNLKGLGLSEGKLDLISALEYGQHTKLVGVFSAGVSSASDPRRMIGDAAFQVAWDSSPGQSATFGALTTLLSGWASPKAGVTANTQMLGVVPELERGLATTLKYVEGSARRLSWSRATFFQGSISSPSWGQWVPMLAAGSPEGELHFCGEHTSVDFRGTLEGAAESGALVAAQILIDRMLPLPPTLESLLALKTRETQPQLRDSRISLPRPLERRRAVLAAHAEFVEAFG